MDISIVLGTGTRKITKPLRKGFFNILQACTFLTLLLDSYGRGFIYNLRWNHYVSQAGGSSFITMLKYRKAALPPYGNTLFRINKGKFGPYFITPDIVRAFDENSEGWPCVEKAAYKAECASYMEHTTAQKQMLPFKSLSPGQMISFIPHCMIYFR